MEYNKATPSETKFFEFCYADGDKELRMGGISLRLRDLYRDYYAWRKENEKKDLETKRPSIQAKN